MSHLTHLRTFIEVYRVGSFSRAAERLGITQPAASLHIQSLETLVGKPLFIRQPRGVTATAAADDLARTTAPFIDGLAERLNSYRPGVKNGRTLHFIGSADFLCYRFTDTLSILMKAGYRVRFRLGNREQIYRALEENSVDFAITSSLPDPHRYEYVLLLTERMLLVYSPRLTPTPGEAPTEASLSHIPLIAYDEDLPLVRLLWSAQFGHPPPMQASLTVPDLRVIRQMVIAGQGWSVLPDYHCADALADGRLQSPASLETTPASQLYLVWAKGRAVPDITRLADLILDAFAN